MENRTLYKRKTRYVVIEQKGMRSGHVFFRERELILS